MGCTDNYRLLHPGQEVTMVQKMCQTCILCPIKSCAPPPSPSCTSVYHLAFVKDSVLCHPWDLYFMRGAQGSCNRGIRVHRASYSLKVFSSSSVKLLPFHQVNAHTWIKIKTYLCWQKATYHLILHSCLLSNLAGLFLYFYWRLRYQHHERIKPH